jgi:hypothetical protein
MVPTAGCKSLPAPLYIRGDFMVTEQEITQVLDRALGHIQNGYVMKNIVDYQKYGHQTPLDGAKVSVGIGGTEMV